MIKGGRIEWKKFVNVQIACAINVLARQPNVNAHQSANAIVFVVVANAQNNDKGEIQVWK